MPRKQPKDQGGNVVNNATAPSSSSVVNQGTGALAALTAFVQNSLPNGSSNNSNTQQVVQQPPTRTITTRRQAASAAAAVVVGPPSSSSSISGSSAVVAISNVTTTAVMPTSNASITAASKPIAANSKKKAGGQKGQASKAAQVTPGGDKKGDAKAKSGGRKGKGRTAKAAKTDDKENEEEDEDDEDSSLPFTLKSRKRLRLDESFDQTQSAQRSTGAGGGKRGKQAAASSSKNPSSSSVATTQVVDESVEIEVDLECVSQLGTSAKVYYDAAKKCAYSVMLNQANIQQNNNKFFVVQVLENKKSYSTWFRWGRVGFKGQSKLISCGTDLQWALREFEKKFHEKTGGNSFSAGRSAFCKKPGKYDWIEVTRSDGKGIVLDNADASRPAKSVVQMASKLDPKQQHLIELICDLKAMEADVRRMDFDVQRSPLGKITKQQLKAGFESLSRIETHIMENRFDQQFRDAVNEYYTRIPHNFGMRVPPLINTLAQLKLEIELLETLAGIEQAVSAMQKAQQIVEEESPLDKRFRQLRYAPRPMNAGEEMYKLINNYLGLTHGDTHSQYRMTIRNVFELIGAPNGGNPHRGLGNRRLLWHGSRLTNWFGILTQGLRIAPPEAPVTGYMFGKGVYFADASSKSANYTYPERGQPGLLVLAEVTLGEMEERIDADQYLGAGKLPAGKHSVKGVGQSVPNPAEHITLADGVLMPCGRLMKNKNTIKGKEPWLNYNEYIVYDTTQIRERYLVEVDFQFRYN